MSKVTIVGTGYVGLVTGTCLAYAGHEVICCEVNQSIVDKLQNGICTIYEPGLEELLKSCIEKGNLSFTTEIEYAVIQSDIIFVCVGTPSLEDGTVDLRYVDSVAVSIGKHINGYKIIINKSTVPIGTADRVEGIIRERAGGKSIHFDVVSNPEFLREGSAVNDFLQMERTVIGAANQEVAAAVADLYQSFSPKLHITDVKSAEMIKYASNAFLATKISFINSVANLCELVGADVESVAVGMGMDSRIGNKFLKAGVGFGGSCFKKDLHGLLETASDHGYDFSLLHSVLSVNNYQRKLIVDKLQHIWPNLKGKTIAVLGLAFKPNTDDMRDAPSLDIIRELSAHGVIVKAYDPVAIPNAKAWIKEQVHYFEDIYQALENCDGCVILTEWEQIKGLDLSKAKQIMNHPVIIDGRNCWSISDIENSGLIYISVGRNVLSNGQHSINFTEHAKMMEG